MKKIAVFILTAFLSFAFVHTDAQIDSAFNDHSPKIIVSPNPAPGNYIVIENDSCDYDHFDRLLIFNSNGVVLQNKQLKMYKGTTKQQVDISGYQPGNYFIRIVDPNDAHFSFATQLIVD
jgi:hypothetical protein